MDDGKTCRCPNSGYQTGGFRSVACDACDATGKVAYTRGEKAGSVAGCWKCDGAGKARLAVYRCRKCKRQWYES